MCNRERDVPTRYKSLAKYLAKYVLGPPISVRRIDAYGGQSVTYHYRSNKTERVEKETVDVWENDSACSSHSVSTD